MFNLIVSDNILWNIICLDCYQSQLRPEFFEKLIEFEEFNFVEIFKIQFQEIS